MCLLVAQLLGPALVLLGGSDPWSFCAPKVNQGPEQQAVTVCSVLNLVPEGCPQEWLLANPSEQGK